MVKARAVVVGTVDDDAVGVSPGEDIGPFSGLLAITCSLFPPNFNNGVVLELTLLLLSPHWRGGMAYWATEIE